MSIRADVYRHMETHPNQKVYLKDIAEALEVEDPRSIQQVMSRALRIDELPGLESVQRGQTWIYKQVVGAEVVENNSQFTVVGETREGLLILEDEHNGLWRANAFKE